MAGEERLSPERASAWPSDAREADWSNDAMLGWKAVETYGVGLAPAFAASCLHALMSPCRCAVESCDGNPMPAELRSTLDFGFLQRLQRCGPDSRAALQWA